MYSKQFTSNISYLPSPALHLHLHLQLFGVQLYAAGTVIHLHTYRTHHTHTRTPRNFTLPSANLTSPNPLFISLHLISFLSNYCLIGDSNVGSSPPSLKLLPPLETPSKGFCVTDQPLRPTAAAPGRALLVLQSDHHELHR